MQKKISSQQNLSFEKAMQRLEEIANNLDQDAVSLEKSLDQFEEGMQLAKICENHLNAAEGRVDKVMKDFSIEELNPDTENE